MLKEIRKNFKLIIFILFAVLLVLPGVIGLMHSGFPLTDDGNWMVIRFSAFYEALRNGQFPVRFLMRLNNGYGYPVADFLYPLFMYIGTPIHMIGFSFVNTIKIILILSLLSSSVFSFLWLRKIFNNLSALAGAILYTLFPYHLFDVYQRGSVGEVLSLAILPFVLWQIEKKNFFLLSLGVSLLIIAHNTLALLFIPAIILYALLRYGNFIRLYILSVIFGFLISAFFWIPALYDTQYTVFSSTAVSDFYNYFVGFKNFDILGIIFIVILILNLTVLAIKKDSRKNKVFFYSVILLLVISFFLFPFSKAIWEIIPIKNIIQFPFRLISLLIVLMSFQLAYLLNLTEGKKKTLVFFVTLILIYVSAKPYLLPKEYQYHQDTFYSTNQDTTTVKNEYMPKWVTLPLSVPPIAKVQNIEGEEEINMLEVNGNNILFQVDLVNPRSIQVNTVYFPGLTAYINGIKTDNIFPDEQGLVRLKLGKGQNNVLVTFNETGARGLSNLASLVGLVVLVILYILTKRKKGFKFLSHE